MHITNKRMKGKRLISQSHSTAIDAAVSVVKTANGDPHVRNIALGPIKAGLPVVPRRIKFLEINGGLKVTVRGTLAEQILYVYTRNPSFTREFLSASFERRS